MRPRRVDERLEVVAALEDADHRQRAPAQRRRLRRQPREVLLLRLGGGVERPGLGLRARVGGWVRVRVRVRG